MNIATTALQARLEEMERRKDGAYEERNCVVAALAQCFPSGVARTAIEGWSEDWHGCVYIDLPTGQVSWHFHDSQAHLFASLPAYTKPWDGHDTPEKYRRVAALSAPAQDAPIDMVLHCPACGMQHIDAPDARKSRWHVGDRALTPYGVGTISRLSSGTGFTEAYFADLELPSGHFAVNERDLKWPNEPHRSHLCHGCGHIWRPADVPTNGVAAVKTRGKADSPLIGRAAPAAAAQDAQADEQVKIERALAQLIDLLCPGLDSGNLLRDAEEAARVAARTQPATPAQDAAATASRQRRQVADLRDAKWLDPRCADRGACQSLVFAQESATPVPVDAAATVPCGWILVNPTWAAAQYSHGSECPPWWAGMSNAKPVYATPPAAPHPVARQRQAWPHDASDRVHDLIGKLAAKELECQRLREAALSAPTAPQAAQPAGMVPLTDHHKLDNDQQVFFYEQDFYVLSNFSSFNLEWQGLTFPTSEHAYHWEKFNIVGAAQAECRKVFLTARSAHDAFKAATELKQYRRADWDDVKVGIMRDILRAKAQQHEYVRRKLLATGERQLIEDSWRDDYWGWGPNRDGQNMLGKLWMEVRAELRAGITPAATKEHG